MTGAAGGRRRPVAAVDCGTNSTRLLVAGPDGATLDRLMRITRLGEGVDRTGRLSSEAIGRTLGVLADYRAVMDRHDVADVFATATSAARDASNSDEFLVPAAEALRTEPQVLTADEEGRLSYRGAVAELAAEDGPFLVVDVGGGSTELVTAAGDGAAAEVVTVSLQIGCVRFTERFLHDDPPSTEQREQGYRFVADLVSQVLVAHPEYGSASTMVGLAGTVSALAVLNLGLGGYDRRRVHHSRLGRRDVARLTDELAAVPLEARRSRPGLEPERADVIIGGAVVLGVVMDGLGCPELFVSESDILDGMVATMLPGQPS